LPLSCDSLLLALLLCVQLPRDPRIHNPIPQIENSIKFKLPPEVWENVIHWAGDVSGQLDTSYLEPMDNNERSWVEHRGNFNQQECEKRYALTSASLSNRYAISLVSKMWNSLATPLLYESIIIFCHRSAFMLERTLIQSVKNSQVLKSHPRPLGLYTKRLEIILPYGLPRDLSRSPFPTILHECRNVEILDFFVNRLHETIRLQTHLTMLNPGLSSLRHIDWGSPGVPTYNFLAQLCNLQHLEVLIFFCHEESARTRHGSCISLPLLHTIETRERAPTPYIRWMCAWKLPLIRRVTFRTSLPTPPKGLLPFLREFGPQIKFLNMIDFDVSDILGTILQYCSSLQHLLLGNYNYYNLHLHQHPSLIKISIDVRYIMHHPAAIRECVAHWTNPNGPAVAVIRLLGLKVSMLRTVQLSETPPWIELFEEFDRRMLHVEYENGDEIQTSDVELSRGDPVTLFFENY
jgi:hypothetical protein